MTALDNAVEGQSSQAELVRLLLRLTLLFLMQSYLELISLYKDLLARKREELRLDKERLENGVTKIAQASAQVSHVHTTFVHVSSSSSLLPSSLNRCTTTSMVLLRSGRCYMWCNLETVDCNYEDLASRLAHIVGPMSDKY